MRNVNIPMKSPLNPSLPGPSAWHGDAGLPGTGTSRRGVAQRGAATGARRIDLVVRKYQWYINWILVEYQENNPLISTNIEIGGISREYILDIKGIFVGYQGNIGGISREY